MGNPGERRRTLVNFGRNLRWQSRCYRPRNDDEVLEICRGVDPLGVFRNEFTDRVLGSE